MTVEAVKEAILHLSETERGQVATWLSEFMEDEWDRQMIADFSPGGRGEHLAAIIEAEIASGNTTSLQEGLREHQHIEQK